MKLNGAQLKAWYKSDWGHEDAWVDCLEISVNGEVKPEEFEPDDIADTDAIVVLDGVIYLDDTNRRSKSVTTHIRNWLKAQSTQDLVVTVETARLEEFRALIKGFQGASIRQG